jgi:hypothetical protein
MTEKASTPDSIFFPAVLKGVEIDGNRVVLMMFVYAATQEQMDALGLEYGAILEPGPALNCSIEFPEPADPPPGQVPPPEAEHKE